jgi:hypothetical protein
MLLDIIVTKRNRLGFALRALLVACNAASSPIDRGDRPVIALSSKREAAAL